MSKCRRLRGLALLAVLGGLGLTASAQDEQPPVGGGYGYLLDNVDFLLDNYTRFLARRYDLNEDQEAYTAELLREKAHRFLDQHKPELRGLVDQLFDVRTGGEMDQQELIEWGKRALPLYNQAKAVIVEGNAEWRGILNEEQKRIHDKDLARMHESFQLTEEQLERIVSGQMTVDEFRNPPRRSGRKRPARPERGRLSKLPPTVNRRDAVPSPGSPAPARPTPDSARQPVAEAPPTPAGREPPRTAESAREPRRAEPRRMTRSRTPQRETTRLPAARPPKTGGERGASQKDFESKWEAYVREFIKKYQLDDEQSQKAHSILKDCQEKARRHMRSCQSTLKRLDARIAAMKDYKGKDKAGRLSKITTQRARLLEPLNQIFERQLKPRLEKLPTSAQRRAAAKNQSDGKSAGSKRAERKDD